MIRTITMLVLPAFFFFGQPAKADQISILNWQITSVRNNYNGTYSGQANITFRATVDSRDQVFVHPYLEQYPNPQCFGPHPGTIGLTSPIGVNRGVRTMTVGIEFTTKPDSSIYIAPGANIMPFRGANLSTPGTIAFGEETSLCRQVAF